MRRLLSITFIVLCGSAAACLADVPDPTLLPKATTQQTPNTGAYDALNVPGMAAGSSYRDPVTNVKVYKVTSSAFPTSGNNWGHDYAEGGNEVSLPYNGSTRAVLVRGSSIVWWIVDFTPGVGVSNPRQLTGNFTPVTDGAFTFSSNPNTPYYAYVSNGGSTIRRFDIRTMTEAPGNGWPVTDSGSGPYDWPLWLHQTENDVFFTWMRGANGDTVVGYEPSSGTKKTYTDSGLNEPRIDRDPNNRSICVSMSTPQNQGKFWDWRNNKITWSSPLSQFGDGQPPVAHQASLHGYWTGVDWNANAPPPLWKISATPNSVVDPLPGGAGPGGGHCNGNWNQNPPNADDQWFSCYVYGTLMPPLSEGDVAPGGILLSTANGERRILAHLYNTATDYFSYSFVKFAPDGRYVMFTSNMDGSSRTDVFLAEMPTSGGSPPDTTPPTVPTGLTTNPISTTEIDLAWNPSTDPDSAVAGYKIYRDGAQIGTSTTTSYADTGLSPSTTYTYTVSSYDPAGNNSNQCPGVPGTTKAPPPPDTTPPTVPTGLTTNPISTTEIDLTWNPSTDPDSAVAGYKIYRNGAQVGTSTTTSYADTGLSPSTTYTYTVSSYDPAGNNSAQCPGVPGTTKAPPPPDTTPPTVPTGLTTNPISSTEIDLTWNPSTDPDSAVAGYKIYRNGAQVGTSATTSYADTGLSPSTTYTYTVSSYDPAGNNSAQCPGVPGTTKAPPPPPTNGLIALLHLDEAAGSTTFSDSSGSGNNGSCSGTGCPTAGAAGKVASALSFNGTTNLVAIASNSGLNAYPLTVETWFKTSSTTGVVGLVNKYVAGSYNGYNVFLNNGNVCAWYLRDGSNYAYDGSGCTFNIAGYNNNVWHQVVYVVDSSGGKLYLDGVQKGSTIGWTGTPGAITTTQDVQLGHYPGAFGGVEYFTGLLDQVRIYNTALTATDVSSLYDSDNGPPPDTTPPTVPTGLITNPISTTEIDLTWNPSTDPDSAVAGYKIYRNGAQIGTSTITSYADTGLSPSTTYTYTVSSYDPAGNNSNQCPGVPGTTKAPPPDITPPTVPTGLTTNPISSTEIDLTWNPSTDPDSAVAGYKIYRNGAQVGTSTTTSYADTGLSPSTTYTYTVSSYDPAGNNSAQCLGVPGTTKAPPPPTNGLIAFLHLDEPAGSTTFSDSSGSGNNGSCSGTGCPTAGVAGRVGSALSFNGTTNLVSIASNSGLNAYPLTVETWFKTSSTTGVVGLVNKYVSGSYNGYNVFLNNGNVCAWYLRDGSNYAYDGSGCTFNIAGYNNNAWHQVVYVVDSSGGKLYLDGVQKGSTVGWTGTPGAVTTTQPVHLGHYPGAFGGKEYFTGVLDQVRIYNTALSAADVSSLYNADNQ